MKTRLVIYADEGKVLTNGETYGRTIYLANGENSDNYHEISEAEYQQYLKETQGSLEI